MKNRSRFFISYAVAWMLISVFHALLLKLAYLTDWRWAIADSMINNTLLFVHGMGLYLMLQYDDMRRFSTMRTVMQLVFSYLVALSLFYIVSDPLLQYVAGEDEVYRAFFTASRIPRLIVGAMMLLLMLIFFRFFHNLQALREKTEQSLRLQSLLRESELTALRWQINPHFLFNSLNSASALTISNPAKSREMIIKLSDLLRYSLRKSDENTSSLEQELRHVSLYTDIEKVRFGDRLRVSISAPVECMSLRIPFLILQPLIENAVKHGVYSTELESDIVVDCSCQPGWLLLSIKNSYDPTGRTRAGTGTGLSNTAGRLRLMYNDDSLMKTIDSGTEFTVTLKIPQS